MSRCNAHARLPLENIKCESFSIGYKQVAKHHGGFQTLYWDVERGTAMRCSLTADEGHRRDTATVCV